MKKVCCGILMVILLAGSILPIRTGAVEARAMTIAPGLSFSGTTAYCDVTVLCDYSTDEIDATMKLWEGNFCIATWNGSDEGMLVLDETYSGVTKGQEYTVTVDVVINGVSKPRVFVKRTC